MKPFYFLILAIITPSLSFAVVDECSITPAIWQLSPVPEIIENNNLTRATGSSEFAQGKTIEISGVILDQNCVPVSGAIVDIWQANSKGGFDFKKDTPSNLRDPNFSGTGKAITDNQGMYLFKSVFPGVQEEKRAPSVNFRVTHKDFLPLETVMYFEGNPSNEIDHLITKEVPENKRNLLVANSKNYFNNGEEEDIKYKFDITLEGNNKYKNY